MSASPVITLVFKIIFLLTSVSSAIGFGFARTLHSSNGPSKKISNFSVFMAYSFGLYLLACLGLCLVYVAARAYASAGIFFLLFCFPSVLAYFGKSYKHAKTVFNLQILGLIAGILALARLG